MNPLQKAGLARLMLRWPTQRDVLARATGSTIQDLYENYEEASRAYEKWTRKEALSSITIAEEYGRMVVELEDEIAQILSANSGLNGGIGRV